MRRNLTIGVVALSFCFVLKNARAEVVYEQAPLLGTNMVQPGDGGYWEAAESSTPDGKGTTGFYGSSMADNFTLASTDTITNVAWTGYIENYDPTDDSNIAGFVIDFYKPGIDPYNFNNTPIYEQYVSLADANAVVDEDPNVYGTATYSFNADLTTPQLFVGGQEYFVAINADIINSNNSSYFWSGGVTNANDPTPNTIAVDGHAATNGYSFDVIWPDQFGNPNSQPQDLAFTLSDAIPAPTTVPLPASACGGIALLAMLGASRLRRAGR